MVDLPEPVAPQTRKSPFLASRNDLSAAGGTPSFSIGGISRRQQTHDPAQPAAGRHAVHTEAAAAHADGIVMGAGLTSSGTMGFVEQEGLGEAYSLAILFAEQLELHSMYDRVTIYATDVDDEALAQARHASYVETHIGEVSHDRRSRYFDRTGDRFTVRPELRRVVSFSRHDLLRDAAVSPVDLVLCRNTLMVLQCESAGRSHNPAPSLAEPGRFSGSRATRDAVRRDGAVSAGEPE